MSNNIIQSKAEHVLDEPLLELSKLVSSEEILAINSPNYLSNIQPWSTGKDKQPKLVLRPRSIDSLSKIVTFLSDTNLDYAVRTSGFGSASASDVLISLSALDDFEFDLEGEYVLLGAGSTWKAYYDKMAEVAPEWSGMCPMILDALLIFLSRCG